MLDYWHSANPVAIFTLKIPFVNTEYNHHLNTISVNNKLIERKKNDAIQKYILYI